MYEEKNYLLEIESALHERERNDLLCYMQVNINSVVSKMDNLKIVMQNETGTDNKSFDEATGRMYYIYSLFINLWVCRN
jgi:hypothetical protein